MKKYVKPETIVKDVVLTSMIASSDITLESGGSTSSVGITDVDAKTRDVWKDGFWD